MIFEGFCHHFPTLCFSGLLNNPPDELFPEHVFLVFLHRFFGPAWFCIKSHTFYVFFYSDKDHVNVLDNFTSSRIMFSVLIQLNRFEIRISQSLDVVLTIGTD
jgi:hypothetical protein